MRRGGPASLACGQWHGSTLEILDTEANSREGVQFILMTLCLAYMYTFPRVAGRPGIRTQEPISRQPGVETFEGSDTDFSLQSEYTMTDHSTSDENKREARATRNASQDTVSKQTQFPSMQQVCAVNTDLGGQHRQNQGISMLVIRDLVLLSLCALPIISQIVPTQSTNNYTWYVRAPGSSETQVPRHDGVHSAHDMQLPHKTVRPRLLRQCGLLWFRPDLLRPRQLHIDVRPQVRVRSGMGSNVE
ncbi:MAG: hypothetical protein Q9162_006878 [Coniocarpon cinnabarinum]